jgi:putative ABC transport system permease protein
VILSLALRSLRHRAFTVALTVLSIALSVSLLLGIERLRDEARESFAATISGTDLVVGTRTSAVHLLLASVFRIGEPAGGLRWTSYRALADLPAVAWTIPLSLGDSHRGYRVLGAEVARTLGYVTGSELVLAHGGGEVSFSEHADQPFRVSGILAPTGTPVDRTVHVSLDAIDALHAPVRATAEADPLAAALHAADAPAGVREADRTITAVLVGLRSRTAALSVQRSVNTFAPEPLTAILPGATLAELWGLVAVAEQALRAVSIMAVVVGLAGMLVALLTGLAERRREMAVLRAVGARPAQIFGLVVGEAACLTLAGVATGLAAVQAGLALAQPWLAAQFGLFTGARWPSSHEWQLMALVVAAGTLVGLLPAWRLTRQSLTDGLTVRA